METDGAPKCIPAPRNLVLSARIVQVAGRCAAVVPLQAGRRVNSITELDAHNWQFWVGSTNILDAQADVGSSS